MTYKFYKCKHCGKIIGMVKAVDVPTICCGEPMEALIPNTVEAAKEKHIPVVKVSGDTVTVDVGSVAHPMTAEHMIEWVFVETENGGQRKTFKPGDAPHAEFVLKNDKLVAVYAYCNLHGLWKA